MLEWKYAKCPISSAKLEKEQWKLSRLRLVCLPLCFFIISQLEKMQKDLVIMSINQWIENIPKKTLFQMINLSVLKEKKTNLSDN